MKKLIVLLVNMNKLPVSPHLSIYSMQITSVMSIFHRITGIVIFFAMSIAIILFSSMMYNHSRINLFLDMVECKFTRVFLLLCLYSVLWSVAYHCSNGIRFLWIDVLAKINNSIITRTGYIACLFALVFGIVYTIYTW